MHLYISTTIHERTRSTRSIKSSSDLLIFPTELYSYSMALERTHQHHNLTTGEYICELCNPCRYINSFFRAQFRELVIFSVAFASTLPHEKIIWQYMSGPTPGKNHMRFVQPIPYPHSVLHVDAPEFILSLLKLLPFCVERSFLNVALSS